MISPSEKICVPIVARRAADFALDFQKATRLARFVELRLDYLDSAEEMRRALHLCENLPNENVQRILTLRRTETGGYFRASFPEQIDLLEKLSRPGDWVDLEMEALELRATSAVQRFRDRGVKIIASFHNFDCTPHHWKEIAHRLLAANADAIKVATRAHTLRDNVVLRQWARHLMKNGVSKFIVLGMGPEGLASRVLSIAWGGWFTFAALEAGKESAEGQLPAETLTSLYRIDHLNASTQVFGLLGFPIEHTLSPLLYNTLFQRRGMDAVYLPFASRHLDGFEEWASEFGVRGLSVTLPHKTVLLSLCDSIDPLAKEVGAINTIAWNGHDRFGYNTDVDGVLEPLRRTNLKAPFPALVLGAGGAARAAVVALQQLGARIFVWNRTREKAAALASHFGLETCMEDQLHSMTFDLVINATSAGMWPDVNSKPLERVKLSCRYAFDFVYHPRETRFLREAAQAGTKTISGIEMFMAQARAQIKILTGMETAESELREILNHA